MRRITVTLTLVAGFTIAAACGGISAGTHGAGKVQSDGMSKTYAGHDRCDPKRHDRPFIIEWDGTDVSSFEAHAKDDIVFVRYEGCDLKVIDSCRIDSVRGSLGSYRPVAWTSGSVEVMEIHNEGELYAKLPLGVDALAGRVQGGETFRMEYFVAGTKTATRDTIYRGDLNAVAGCEEVTHFVYGYNLGAFALGASSHLDGEAGGTVWGMGVGGSQKSSQAAEKRGGLLSSCRAESAKETETCQTPIRLTLREVNDGANPDQAAAIMPDTPSSLNLAAKVKIETDTQREAYEHLEQARSKANASDGEGCLAELDVHDRLDPRPAGLSSNSKSATAMVRAQCLMLSGQCDAGKKVYRISLQANSSADIMGPEQIDRGTDAVAGMWCQGTSMGARDRITKATFQLTQGAYQSKKPVPVCMESIQTLRSLLPSTKPRDEDDSNVLNAPDTLYIAGVGCVAKAGDCDAAWKLFRELDEPKMRERLFANASEDSRERQQTIIAGMRKSKPEQRASVQRSTFEAYAPKCAAKK